MAIAGSLHPVVTAASAVDYFDPAYTSADIGLSGSNAVATRGAAADNWRTTLAKLRKTTGKWYFEVLVGTLTGKDMIGFGDPLMNLSNYVGGDAHGFGWHSQVGNFYYKGAVYKAGPGTYVTGDVLQFCVDMDAGMLWLGKNGVIGGNPAAGTSPAFNSSSSSLMPTPIAPAASLFHKSDVATLRVKNSEFTYAPPAGFSSWSGV